MSAPRRYAFITGINRYGNNIPALGSAVKDAEAIARVLQELHGYEVELHLDEQATLEKLRALFQGLRERVHEDDRVVIYFAGHGVAESAGADADGPRGYFVPQDADRDRIETFLPMAEVQGALDQIKGKHLLVLLDCCFAGAFKWSRTRAVMGRPGTLYKERYERYLREPARQVITSASSSETALDVVSGKVLGVRDAGGDHSPFAQALISALRDSVADVGFDGQKGDGVTTATELFLYIESALSRAESALGRAVQKPMLWQIDDRGQGGEFLFEVPGRQLDLPSALVLSEENNPYRGLSAYDEQHAALFFGREKLTEQLAETVAKQSLTLVVGASGSGKSSLVKAGLVHQLKGTSKRWAILPPVRPGTSPGRAIGAAIEAGRAQRAREPEVEVLLVVDQLEELVTMASGGRDERASFFAALDEARAAGLRVVCTLRADFEPHFLEIARKNPGARFPVRSMSRDELREVIEGPARDRALDFDPPALVDELIDEVHDSPGALPLLSFTLSELYRERIKRDAADRSLTKADYDKLGGVTGALGTRADAIYDGQPDEAAKKTMERVLLRLVSLEGGEAAKRRLPTRELVSTDAETDCAGRIVEQLTAARLVVEGREDGPAPTGEDDARAYVEAAHDKLVTGWKRLWEILAEHRAELPLLRACTAAADAWEANGRAGDRLWNADPRLPQLQAFQKKDPLLLNALETRFVEQSGRRRRSRFVAVGVAVVAVIAGLSVQTVKATQATTKATEAATKATQAEARANVARDEALARARVEQGFRAGVVAGQAGRETEGLVLAIDAAAGHGADPATAPAAVTEGMARGFMLVHQLGTLEGHTEDVEAVAFSPDGARLVTASADKTARLWDAKDGKPLATLLGHTETVSAVAFSPDGTRVATASKDKTARLWDAKDGKPLATILGHTETVSAVAFSPDGTRLVTASADKTARLWDAKDGKPLTTLQGHTGEVSAVAFSPDGTRLVTASADKTARLWGAQDGKPLATLRGHTGAVGAVAFSPDSTRVATASDDKTARLWDAEDGKPLATLQGHTDVVEAVAFSPDGTRLATASGDKTARLWDAKDGKPLATLQGHTELARTVAFSPDSTRVVTSSWDKTARLWDANYGKPLTTLQGHTRELWAAAFSPDGTRLVTSGRDKTARLWDAKDGKPLTTLQGHTGELWDVALSPDGTRLVTASRDKTARLWGAQDGKPLATLRGHTGAVGAVAFSPDSTRVATASDDKTARLWDAGDGKPLATLQGHTDEVWDVAFSPDGTRVVTASWDNTLRLWDAKDGKPLVTLQGHQVLAVAFSPDGTRLATASQDGTAQLWDVKAGKPLATLQGHTDEVSAVAFSPDGTRVVTASKDKTARLWDAKDGKPLATLQGHAERVLAVAFSPDGTRVVTASEDKTARLWDAKDGKPLVTFLGHTDQVLAVALSPDGTRVATASLDKTARLWDAKTGDLLAVFGHLLPVLSVAFSPDGRHLATTSDTVRIWSATPEGFLIQSCQYLRPLPAYARVADTCGPYVDRTP